MKENKYDDPVFFEKYSHMARSERGLAGAGEWPTLKDMLPDLRGKRVLDLAAATAGTANMPPTTTLPGCWGPTSPKK